MCTIAVDFDGTINADFIKAKTALQALRDAGHVIVIWSSRNNPRQHGEDKSIRMDEMKQALREHEIPYDEIDIGRVGKFHAQVYVDDKALRFENNWDEILKRIY